MSLNLADLYIILQSLTKSQKRSFTIYFNSYKPDSNASALFKAINELKEYDREKLIEQLQKMGKHSIAENLIQEATSLYKLVLKKNHVYEKSKCHCERIKGYS